MSEALYFLSAVTTQPDIDTAADELIEQVRQQLMDCFEDSCAPIDLALVFLTSHFTQVSRQVVERLTDELNPGVILGCTAEAVISHDQEFENTPAITMVAARLPGVEIKPFYLHANDKDWLYQLLEQAELRTATGAIENPKLFVLLGDPFSTPMDDVLEAFNSTYPGIPVVGGMASGALRPKGNALLLGDLVVSSGVVGIALGGNIAVDVIVSQGCRPIWRPYRVSMAHRNIIFSVEGQPPLTLIQELIPQLSKEDQALLQNGVFVGRAFKPGQTELGRGDFLVRGIVGVDRQSGAVAIGDSIMEGDMIQFHLRDANTAQEDLEMMLIPQMFRQAPSGALLFLCNGRGMRLHNRPNGDVEIINQSLEASTPLAGFFCAGEIGPIGGINFLHGHTASLVLFRPGAGK